MAYMDGFQANPEELVDKGNRIIGIYERYMEEKANVDRAKERVKDAWAGADATGYVTAIEGYDETFKELGEILNQIGNIIYRHGSRLAESRNTIANIANKL